MKKTRLVLLALLCSSVLAMYSCGGSQMIPPVVPGSSSVSFTMTDAPPTGVTILSFEVTLTGATLNPGNVDLLSGKGPKQIEVKKLETESAFLNTASVPPGTYTSLSLTFSNPEVTFKNDTAGTLAGCAAGQVCEIKPAGTLTSTFNFPSPGIVISAGAASGIQVEVNPNTILSATLGVDFSLAGAVSAKQLAARPAGELDELDDLKGMVQNLDTANKKFTLHTLAGDFPVTVNSNTRFDFDGCAANDFTCLKNGQVVEVDALVMAGEV